MEKSSNQTGRTHPHRSSCETGQEFTIQNFRITLPTFRNIVMEFLRTLSVKGFALFYSGRLDGGR